MPVARGVNRREITALVLALGGVVAAVAIGVAVLLVARGGDVEVRLGSDRWEVGRADRLAAAIADDGPFLVADVSGGDRDLYVSHIGDDPQQGWHAFAARAGGRPRECALRWEPDERVFSDPCGEGTYPLDGAGLEQFPVSVVDGGVLVDINRSADPG